MKPVFKKIEITVRCLLSTSRTEGISEVACIRLVVSDPRHTGVDRAAQVIDKRRPAGPETSDIGGW